MANPARKYDDRPELSPGADPYAPVPPLVTDPAARDPRIAANDPYVNNQVVTRGSGNGVIIAAVVLVLAVVAFFIFGPGVSNDPAVTPDQPAVTAPVDPAAPAGEATPAPNAMAPAAPADPAVTAPDATAPAAPADPAAPAPDASAPAEPAPAQ